MSRAEFDLQIIITFVKPDKLNKVYFIHFMQTINSYQQTHTFRKTSMKNYIHTIRLLFVALLAMHYTHPANAQKGSLQKKDPYNGQFTMVPANDNCSNASMLSVGNTCNTISGTVSGATQSIMPIFCNGYTSSTAFDVWFKFVAGNANESISVFGSSTFDAVIELLDSCNGNYLGCADNSGVGKSENIYTSGLIPGQTYYIRVYHYGSSLPSTPTFDICIYHTPLPPINDECSAALPLIPAITQSACNPVVVSTFSATPSLLVDPCTGTYADDDVWYSFTANDTTITLAAQNLSIGLNGVGFVLYADVCGGQASAECSSRASGNLLSFNKLIIGKKYYLRTFTSGTVLTGSYELCAFAGIPDAPLNDFCSDAINLVPDSTCIPTLGNVIGATESFPADSCDGYVSPSALDVWYTFTAKASYHIVHINESSDFDAVITLYDGCGGNSISCADKNSGGGLYEDIYAKNLIIGNTYFIRVFHWGGKLPITTNFSICVSTPNNPPANDDCSHALAISPGMKESACSTIQVITSSATPSPMPPSCSGTSFDDDVWYSFTANDTAFTVKASNFSAGIIGLGMVLYADSCNGTQSVECTTQATNNLQIFHQLIKGKKYFLRTFTTGITAKGTYDICTFFGWPTPPANDNCANAIPLTVTNTCNSVIGNTYAATPSIAPMICSGSTSPTANDVWYSFVAATSFQNIKVTGSSEFDAVVLLYDSCGGNLLDCADHTLKGDTENVRAKGLVPGKKYAVRVYAYGSIEPATTTFDICIYTPPSPPSNDECNGAISITPASSGANCNYTLVNTNSATKSLPVPSCSSNSIDDDVWYTFVANDSSITAKAQNLSTGLTGVGFVLYSDSCKGKQSAECTSLAVNNELTFKNLIPGNTYFLRTFTNGISNMGTYDLCVFKGAATPPANDDCSSAKNLTIGASCNPTSGTLAGATESMPADSCSGSSKSKTANDVWYSFTPSAANISIEVSGAGNFNPVVLLYDACGGNIVNCSDANSTNAEKLIVKNLSTGKKYFIRVYHNGATSANNSSFNICVYLTPPAPVNDECNAAINLSVGVTCSPISGDVKYATPSIQASVCNSFTSPTAYDLWYSFTAANVKQTIEVAGSASFDAVIILYDSCGGNIIDCADQVLGGGKTEKLLAKGLQIGKKYMVRVYPYANSIPTTTTFSICVYNTPTAPVNDECSGAIQITQATNFSNCSYTTVSTIDALKSIPIPVCASTSADDDVWYTFTAIDTVVNVRSQNLSSGITGIGYTLYKGSCVGTSPGCIALAQQNQYRFHGITIGATYYLRTFTDGNTKTGTYDMCVYGGKALLNDECNNAMILNVDTSCKPIIGYAALATQSLPADSCNPANTGSVAKDLWYSFTATTPNINIKVAGTIGFNAHLQLLDGCNGNVLSCADSTLSAGIEMIRARGLTIGHTYLIRIYNYAPPANTSNIFTLCIYSVVTPGIQNITNHDNLIIYPNPAHAEMHIKFKSQDAGTIEIRFYNLSGQLIYQNKSIKTGAEYNSKINTYDYPKGIYLLQIISEKWVDNRKVILE